MEPHLTPVVAMLEEAFPAGVGDEDYLPLLAVLSEGLNEWNVGVVASAFLGAEHHRVLNDAARRLSRPQRDRAAALRARLARHGWDPDEDRRQMRPFGHEHERELLAGPGFLEDRAERRCPACGDVAVRMYAYRSFQRAAPSIISYLWCASCRRYKGWTGPDLGRFELSEPLSADDREELRGTGTDALFRRLDALWEEGTLPQRITPRR